MLLTPFRPATGWRLDGDELVETIGKRERRWPLSSLRSLTLTLRGRGGRQAAWIATSRGRITLASHSWAGLGTWEDRGDSFGPFVRTVAARAADANPAFRVSTAVVNAYSSVATVVGMLGLGVLALVLFSLTSGAAGLGVSLAARMAFVLILVFAVTPWFDLTPRRLDPRDLPATLLP